MDWSHVVSAAVGYGISFTVEHFRHKSRRKNSKEHAESLFRHLHEEKVRTFDHGLSIAPNVVAQSTRLLLSRAKDIQTVINDTGDTKLTVRFLKYMTKLEELDEHVRAGHMGLVSSPSRQADEIFQGKA